MKILIYSSKDFEQPYLREANVKGFEMEETEEALSLNTAALSKGYDAISVFTGDDVSAPVVKALHEAGVRFIAIRAAGYDNVDLAEAAACGIKVANVPAYSPYAVGEHAVALMLALNRQLILASTQVQHHDFRVNKLMGFDMQGKTVGIIGTGRIGQVVIRIMHGFGCKILGYDIAEDASLVEKYGVEYVDLSTLCTKSDIISIHTGLSPATKYMIDEKMIGLMKKGVMLINTGRGACVNTKDVLAGLADKSIGYYGADVYEKERGVYFYDFSNKTLEDETLQALLSYPNVLMTPHQAFATAEALGNIAQTTFENIGQWAAGKKADHELQADSR